MHPPVTEHVPLHSKSLYNNMARAPGGTINMYPISWGHKRNRSAPFLRTKPKRSDKKLILRGRLEGRLMGVGDAGVIEGAGVR